jgi:hypothetical protein
MPGILAAARREYRQRAAGRDRLSYQHARAATAAALPAQGVVFPLSVEWDSSALGRHHLFPDTTAWLVATIEHVLEHSSAPVIVRQHPSERRALERSHSDTQAQLADRFGAHPRFHFVKAEAEVNTYALLSTAALVLPHVSTIGIEAAAIGKLVILAGRTYYGSLGFAYTPDSRAAYLALIDQALTGNLPLLPDQQHRAWLCYYLNAVCYRVFTEFSPQPPDFWRWCRRRPSQLFATRAVQDLLTAIDANIPLALVRHWRRLGQRPPGVAALTPSHTHEPS